MPHHTADDGYHVPDITLHSPANRKLRVVTIGAGFSGIMCAYQFEKKMTDIEHQVYEKNPDVGGAWYENRYPGCACDVPAHAYAFNFALNPNWPKLFSEAPDIQKYLADVTDILDLRKYMKFNHRVAEARWDEGSGKWKLTIDVLEEQSRQKVSTIYDEADMLIQASGLLNNYKMPKIDGIEKFKGRIVHTAAWPKDFQAEQWKENRMAIIGSGSSSLQTVATMQPHAKHMDIFVRTGVWFISLGDNTGANKDYSEEEKTKLRENPQDLMANVRNFECHANAMWPAMFEGSDLNKTMYDMSYARMKELITDERLLKGFTPKFSWGCRRVTPGDPYMRAIQKPNVDVHFTPVIRITEDGVVGEDGTFKECDTIICATGFDTSYRPAYSIIGENGVSLRDKWAHEPQGYIGVGVPGFPNLVSFFGPTWPVAGGSVTGSLDAVCGYAMKFMRKLQEDLIKSMSPRQDITDKFNEHTQALLKGMVWESDCRSWYKDNETGRVTAVWPGSALHFQAMMGKPRWEDYEIKYQNEQNPWYFLGRGFTIAEKEGGDLAPYLKEEFLDPRFYQELVARAGGPSNGEDQVVAKNLGKPVEHGAPAVDADGHVLTTASTNVLGGFMSSAAIAVAQDVVAMVDQQNHLGNDASKETTTLAAAVGMA